MGRYILKRLLSAVVAFFGITIITYVLASLMPGTPLDMLIQPGSGLSPQEIAEIEHRMGLDQPLIVQYFYWMGNMFKGNFGISYSQYRPVWDLLMDRIGPTLLLSISSLIIALAISVPLGTAAGYKAHSGWDYGSTIIAFIGRGAPTFFVALLLIYVFSIQLGWLPASGMYDAGSTGSLGELLAHMTLPCATMVLANVGIFTRQMRNSMVECLSDDYIRTARAKGMSERVVLFRHTLRNALQPVVTQAGLALPTLVGGSIVIEQIFAWPGMGTLMLRSIQGRDYPTIMGITVLISVVVLVGNVLLDVIYRMLDPRIGDNC